MAAANSTSCAVENRFCKRSRNSGVTLAGVAVIASAKFQHQLLISAKQVAFRIPVQVPYLIIADACSSATGRVDVDSKRTFHLLGGADLA